MVINVDLTKKEIKMIIDALALGSSNLRASAQQENLEYQSKLLSESRDMLNLADNLDTAMKNSLSAQVKSAESVSKTQMVDLFESWKDPNDPRNW